MSLCCEVIVIALIWQVGFHGGLSCLLIIIYQNISVRFSQVAKALEEAHDETEIGKDADEELHLWEQEQIKKGASIPASHKDQALGPALPQAEHQMQIQSNFPSTVPISSAHFYHGQGNDELLVFLGPE